MIVHSEELASMAKRTDAAVPDAPIGATPPPAATLQPDVEGEALALVAERHGPAALQVLDQQIARMASGFESHAASLAAPTGDWVLRFVKDSGPYLLARRRYQARRD